MKHLFSFFLVLILSLAGLSSADSVSAFSREEVPQVEQTLDMDTSEVLEIVWQTSDFELPVSVEAKLIGIHYDPVTLIQIRNLCPCCYADPPYPDLGFTRYHLTT